MVANTVDSIPDNARPSLVMQFARFWSANMDLIHAQKQSWPGFGYTDDEKAAMHDVATAMSRMEFYATMLLAVIFTLIIAAFCIGIMFWRLNVKYGADPARTPEVEFFFYLALACITTLAGGIPVSILAASWITSRLFTPAPGSVPDLAFSQHIFRKATRQIVRMGAIGCIACLVYWIFVPRNSKLDLLVQALAPMLGPVAVVLSVLFYFSGRVTRPGPADSSGVKQESRES